MAQTLQCNISCQQHGSRLVSIAIADSAQRLSRGCSPSQRLYSPSPRALYVHRARRSKKGCPVAECWYRIVTFCVRYLRSLSAFLGHRFRAAIFVTSSSETRLPRKNPGDVGRHLLQLKISERMYGEAHKARYPTKIARHI